MQSSKSFPLIGDNSIVSYVFDYADNNYFSFPALGKCNKNLKFAQKKHRMADSFKSLLNL